MFVVLEDQTKQVTKSVEEIEAKRARGDMRVEKGKESPRNFRVGKKTLGSDGGGSKEATFFVRTR